MNEIDYAARVAKGVALLDEKRPGWEHELNLEILDIEDGSRCITAQLSGRKYGRDSWRDGMEQLGLSGATYLEHGFNAESCGDECHGDVGCQQPAAYATLNTLWREVIEGRLSAD